MDRREQVRTGENRWGHVGTGKDRCCEYRSVLTLTWGSSSRAMRT